MVVVIAVLAQGLLGPARGPRLAGVRRRAGAWLGGRARAGRTGRRRDARHRSGACTGRCALAGHDIVTSCTR